MATEPTDADIRQALWAEVQKRGKDKTCCPSDIARSLATDWRALMPAVRACAIDMASQQLIDITQGGEIVDGSSARGPIRLRLK